MEPTTILALLNSILIVAKEILDKTPDYSEKIRREFHDLEGEYFALKSMKRTDGRFWTERLLKVKAQRESFIINLAKDIENAKKQSDT
jgi:hypothetical protein